VAAGAGRHLFRRHRPARRARQDRVHGHPVGPQQNRRARRFRCAAGRRVPPDPAQRRHLLWPLHCPATGPRSRYARRRPDRHPLPAGQRAARSRQGSAVRGHHLRGQRRRPDRSRLSLAARLESDRAAAGRLRRQESVAASMSSASSRSPSTRTGSRARPSPKSRSSARRGGRGSRSAPASITRCTFAMPSEPPALSARPSPARRQRPSATASLRRSAPVRSAVSPRSACSVPGSTCPWST
jgi:hypothetical protein